MFDYMTKVETMENRTKKTTSLYSAVVVFILSFFVYNDFNIRMLYGFVLMGLVLVFFMLTSNKTILADRIGIAYLLMALVIDVFAFLPYSRLEYDAVSLIISLNISVVFVILAKPNSDEIIRSFKWITVVGVLLAFYVIIVAFLPQFYYDFVSKFISQESDRVVRLMLADGYGVAIGGSTVLLLYIVVLTIFILMNYFLLYKLKLKTKVLVLSLFFISLGAMILSNRKSEILMVIVVVILSFFAKYSFTTRKNKRNRIKILLVLTLIVTVLVIWLASMGYLNRYIFFFRNIISNLSGSGRQIDVSSGRLELWAKAFELFKEHPIFGIGWGRFVDHVDMYNYGKDALINNVHNNYLQLLCEVGIIGAIAILTPMFYIFNKTRKLANQLKAIKDESIKTLRLIVNVSLNFQIFMLLVSVIDPIWYKTVFWWFYGIVIILSCYGNEQFKVVKARGLK